MVTGKETQMVMSVDNRLQQERGAELLERGALFYFSSLSPFSDQPCCWCSIYHQAVRS